MYLNIATLGLSIPLVLRGIFDLLVGLNDDLSKFFWEENWGMSMVFINIIGNIVPAIF